jgi:hypothetical protein
MSQKNTHKSTSGARQEDEKNVVNIDIKIEMLIICLTDTYKHFAKHARSVMEEGCGMNFDKLIRVYHNGMACQATASVAPALYAIVFAIMDAVVYAVPMDGKGRGAE